MTLIHAFGLLVAFFGLLVISFYATTVVSASLGRAWAVAVYLGLALILLDANPNAFIDVGINLDRLLRLLIGMGALVIGLAYLPKTYRLVLKPPAIFLLVYVLFALLSTVYSATPGYTFETGMILFGFILFSAAAARVLTLKAALMTIAVSLGLFVALSWGVYLVLPEAGRTSAWTLLGYVYRLDGLTAHANILGRVVMLFLGAIFLLFVYRYARLQLLIAPALLGLATLAFSDSRTSMLAFAAALMVFALRRLPWLLILVCLAMIAAVLYLLYLSWLGAGTEVLEALSRTGSADEIATLTGRTELWAVVVEKIKESPWLGYGYGASHFILSRDVTGFGWDHPHAHNMILQSLLNVGVIGTLFLVLALTWQAEALVKRPAAFRDLLFILVVITGLTEAAALRPEPNTLILLWFMSLVWEEAST
jgi:O-antigen ligase